MHDYKAKLTAIFEFLFYHLTEGKGCDRARLLKRGRLRFNPIKLCVQKKENHPTINILCWRKTQAETK